jgi:pilus assembly protein Flp/PilA
MGAYYGVSSVKPAKAGTREGRETRMSNFWQRLRKDERGVSSIEYAVLAVGIALIVLTGAQYLGGNVNSAFSTIASNLTADM